MSPDFVVLWDTHGVRILLFCETHVESGFCCFVKHTWSPDFVVGETLMESGFCCGWEHTC